MTPGESKKCFTRGFKAGGNDRIGAGFVPGLAREDGRGIVVAGEADCAVGIAGLGARAIAVVPNQLEFEACSVLVVADDLKRGGPFVVGKVESILEV